MTKEGLREFVMGLCDGRIFSSMQIPMVDWESSLHLVFMPLAFGVTKDMSEEDISQIGGVWEWLSEAGPRSINGYPSFFSCRFLHKDDLEIARKAYEREMERRKNADLFFEKEPADSGNRDQG
jgi:hypothetical protein